jgi:predicted anti-sigma-YlaC factor YlaD
MSAEMDCAEVRAQLEAFCDGELEEARAARLRGHLEGCPACRAHHAEAASLPARLAALPAPDPPTGLLPGVLHRVRRERVGRARLWGLPAAELLLFGVVLWYLSGPQGLLRLMQRTATDAAGLLGWGAGVARLPAATAGDVFLLLLFGLLVAVTVYHLTLLARAGFRTS